MKRKLLILLMLLLSINAFTQEKTNERARWFIHDRFGMFIHWGVYSGAEGIWKGETHRDANNYAEWIYYRNRISKEEYVTLLDRFHWDEINPEEWVILAKQAGMKYITFTAKHHDGFALWDSKISNYDIGEYTSHKRDMVKELAAACQKHGLKMGLYYSHWVDWEHEYGWDHTREIKKLSSEDYNRYWQEKVIPQMHELLTQYGPISMFWFDMWIHHSETIVTKEQLLQLKNMIRELQPHCLINSRLGLSLEEDPDIDFKTLGDNQLGSKKENFPWQSPATVAHSWGFNAYDTEWKSTTTLLNSLINNVSLNGNLMLNIGPRANGEVPYETIQRLNEMGHWLQVNGESIYGAEAIDLPADMHDWGTITCRKTSEGKNLYLQILNWPLQNKINLTGLTSIPHRVYLLADKSKSPLVFDHEGALTEISLPLIKPDPFVSVAVIEYSGEPDVKPELTAKTTDNGYSLKPGKTLSPATDKITPASRRGTIPAYVAVFDSSQTFSWNIYVDEPGEKTVDISYSMQSNSGKSKIKIFTSEENLIISSKATGKTVGEPNSNWIIDNFEAHRAGNINFSQKGYYTITAEIEPFENDTVKFQWLWLK